MDGVRWQSAGRGPRPERQREGRHKVGVEVGASGLTADSVPSLQPIQHSISPNV
jgi:hypothetical protein